MEKPNIEIIIGNLLPCSSERGAQLEVDDISSHLTVFETRLETVATARPLTGLLMRVITYSIGPVAKPRTYSERPSKPTSVLTPKTSAI